MYENEYQHIGIDTKGRAHTFWSLTEDAKSCCFDGLRWLRNCTPTGKSRKYQEPDPGYSSPTSYAFYH